MINTITLENFKSYEKEIKINLGKITVLIGPNNSGKSSILQALILLSKSGYSTNYILNRNSTGIVPHHCTIGD